MVYDVIFQFSNISKPSLIVKSYEEETINMITFNFASYQLEEGLPIISDDLKTQLDEFLPANRKSALVLLNCDDFFKTTHVLPNLNEKKVRRLYEQELASEYPNLKDYQYIEYDYEISSGRVFYRYFIAQRILDYFKKIFTELGYQTIHYDTLGNYLLNFFNSNIQEEKYIAIYEENEIVSLLVCKNQKLISYLSFGNSKSELMRNMFSAIDRRHYELEKEDFDSLYTNNESIIPDNCNYIVYKYKIGSNDYVGEEI